MSSSSARPPLSSHAFSQSQATQVAAAFAAQKDFIALAAACTKLSSSAPAYATLLGPTQSALVAVVDIKEKNRPAKETNQLSTVSEGIPALGWVTLVSRSEMGCEAGELIT